MTAAEAKSEFYAAANEASRIAEICGLMAQALEGLPETATIGIAIEGVESLAKHLATRLFDAADHRN